MLHTSLDILMTVIVSSLMLCSEPRNDFIAKGLRSTAIQELLFPSQETMAVALLKVAREVRSPRAV